MTYDDHNGYLHVLEDIHTLINPQEFLCVLGPSGCGKTTLLRVIAGLDKDSRGRSLYPAENDRASGSYFRKTVSCPGARCWITSFFLCELARVDPDEARAQGALEMAEIGRVERISSTSGRHLFPAAWPSASLSPAHSFRIRNFFCWMNPLARLDALTREQMGVELLRIWQARRKTVVMVTHSISEALLLADRVLVLSDRPAVIDLDLTNDIPRPRGEETRYTEKFQSYARQLRAAIG